MSPVRVAVIGAGYMGRIRASGMVRSQRATLVGIVELDAGRRQAAAAEFQVPGYSDVETLLQNSTVDAAIICLPPHARSGIELIMAARGIPMLVEKPIAVTLADAEQIAAGLAMADVPVVYGYQWRQLSCLPQIQEMAADRTPHLVLGYWLSSKPGVSWWGSTTTAGSQYVEQATHLIDLALLLAGPVTTVTAIGSAARLADDATNFVKAAGATIAFANGCVGSFVTCCTAPDDYLRSLDVVFDGLAVAIAENGCSLSTETGVVQLNHEGPGLYEREQRAFLELVESGSTSNEAGPLARVADALAAHRVADAIERSITSGLAVTVAPRH